MDLAEFLIADPSLDVADQVVVQKRVTDHESQAGLLGDLDQLHRVLDGVGDGLLHEDVFARLQRSKRVFVMQS